MGLLEGSDVRGYCKHCGKHYWILSVIEGQQELQCPNCPFTTTFYFTRNPDGTIRMSTSVYNK